MTNRRSFLKGLVAATIPLFIPSDRLDFGVPKRIYVPPEPKILASRDIKLHTMMVDSPSEDLATGWGVPSDAQWTEHGIFVADKLVFLDNVARYDYRIDQEIDPTLMSGSMITEVYNKRKKQRVVLNPKLGV